MDILQNFFFKLYYQELLNVINEILKAYIVYKKGLNNKNKK